MHAIPGRISPSRIVILILSLLGLAAGLYSQVSDDSPPPLDDVLPVKLNYALVTNDEVRVALSFRADIDHNYVVEAREQLLANSPCDHWQILPAAPHNFGIVFTTNAANSPQRLYRLRRIDQPFTGLFALLVNDTGLDPYDRLTADPTLSGLVVPSEPHLELQAALDDPVAEFSPLRAITQRQHFQLSPEDLEELNHGPLSDGPHTLYLRTVNADAATVSSFELSFVLDATAPALSLVLDPFFDSPPLGDGETTSPMVTLNGQTEPGQTVELLYPSRQVVSDSSGEFRFPDIPLELGANQFVVAAQDAACNRAEVALTIVRTPPSDCLFEPGLPGWDLSISPPAGKNDDQPGSIVADNCVAVLTEGDSFQVALERTFVVPDGVGLLCFSFATDFESTASGRIRDAFEAALVDEVGRSLVYTLQGSAGLPGLIPPALPPETEAFFNLTEGLPEFVAVGVALEPVGPGPEWVCLDIRHLAPGTYARLILRLINNDFDRASTVRITAVEFRPFNPALDYQGTEPPAFSWLDGAAVSGATGRISDSLEELAAAVRTEHRRTSLNEASGVLYSDVALHNAGTFPIRTPLFIGVRNLSDPSVRLLGADGTTSKGIPFYDYTPVVAGGILEAGEPSLFRTFAFSNPNRVQFSYELTVLGRVNRPPAFTTTPVVEAVVGRPYLYAFHADDPDGDAVTYSFPSAPSGLSLDSPLSTLNWTPTAANLGHHSVVLRADDGRGGVAEQRFTLAVTLPPPNRPPYFVSTPVTLAHALSGNLPIPSKFADGEIFVASSTYAHEVRVYDAKTLQFKRAFSHPLFAGPYDPRGMAFNHRGNLLCATAFDFVEFSDYGVEYMRYRKQTAEANENIIFDRNGNLYTTTSTEGTDQLNQYRASDYSFIQTITLPPGAGSLTGITFDGSGRLYVGSQADRQIHVLQASPGFESFAHLHSFAAPDSVEGIQINQNGELVVAAGAGGGLGRYSPTSGMVLGTFNAPNNDWPVPLTVDHDGSIIVADFENGAGTSAADLFRFSHDGSSYVTANDPNLFGPFGLALSGVPLPGAPSVSTYSYDSEAVDPDNDSLFFRLVASPPGMTIDPETGLIHWSPTVSQIGDHAVTIRVADGRGGAADQSFVVKVVADPQNHPPIIISEPVTTTVINREYTYDVDAIDPDNDSLRYSLLTDQSLA